MSFDRALGIITFLIGLVGLADPDASKVLCALVAVVSLIVFVPPPEVKGGRDSVRKVLGTTLLALQFAAVAWFSVIGSELLIAKSAHADGPAQMTDATNRVIDQWISGARPNEQGIQQLHKPEDPPFQQQRIGSLIVHARPTNDIWIVPVRPVIQEVVDTNSAAAQSILALFGIGFLFFSSIIQVIIYLVGAISLKP